MGNWSAFTALAVTPVLALAGCARPPSTAPSHPPARANQDLGFRYVDITQEAGIHWRHDHGGCGEKYIPESFASGCGFFDYDDDGWLDIFLVNTRKLGVCERVPLFSALYRNRGDGTFQEVTEEAGLRVEMYGMGVTAADYDNDGHTDIFVACLGPDHLFHNLGDGTFEDVATTSGATDDLWSTSAAWFDYDRDGWLDLYVCNYVNWTLENDAWCGRDGIESYCGPSSYDAVENALYHNNGDGSFTDVTTEAGVGGPGGKSLGVAVWDYDDDGWPDLLVANDLTPDFLFRNNQDGSFSEIGMERGVAFAEAGQAKSGMGIDFADYLNDGHLGIIVGQYTGEGLTLFRDEGGGTYFDRSAVSRITEATMDILTFGLFFFDADLDGYKDFFAANGHVLDDITRYESNTTYKQRPQLFHNRRDGTFVDIGPRLGGPFDVPVVGRGAAHGDICNNGSAAILMTTGNGPAHLWRCEGATEQANWLEIEVIGTKSNRDGIGTKITVVANGVTQVDWVRTGSSYLAQSDLRPIFGLGGAQQADLVVLRWPSG
ncbi:MAG: CRTAC1 family protein, partial [Armatimonadota bacterium]